jgi:DNA repair exonuclease SbcCD ATPase subunit
MVIFEEITIQNFTSIDYLQYSFISNTITKVSGVNGSGKTNILLALQQCLYNRTVKYSTLDTTYNRVSKLPYTITVTLVKDGIKYMITNDRVSNSITVIQDGTELPKLNVKESLQYIEQIVGVNFRIFSVLTYINTESVATILTDLTNSDILNSVFNTKRLKDVETSLKRHKKILTERHNHTLTRLRFLDKFLSDKYLEFNQEDLTNTLDEYKGVMSQLESLHKHDLQLLINENTSQISTLKAELQEALLALSNMKKHNEKVAKGICPTCGQAVDLEVQDTSNLESTISELKEQIKDVTSTLTEYQTALDKIRQDLEDKLVELDRAVVKLTERKLYYQQQQSKRGNLNRQKEKLLVLADRYSQRLDVTNKTLDTIRDGTVTKELVSTFIKHYNSIMSEYLEITKLPYKVNIKSTRNALHYLVRDKGKIIDFSTLSKGEKARVAIVSLLSMITAISVMFNININLLVLDEFLDGLDKEGVESLKSLLNNVKQDKSIFVVVHHSSIEDDYFDRIFEISKEDSLTVMKQK